MTNRHEIRVDVSEAVPWPGSEVAVTLVVPDDDLAGPRTVAFGFPGDGYSRSYWDIDWPGGYSQAAFHAERGWLFVAVDHLGVGASSLPVPEALTFEVLAAANDAVVRAVVDRLRVGTLVDGLAPVDVDRTVGFGQSMGGCLSIVAQGTHRTFDAVAVLGYSAIHTVLPSPTGGVELVAAERGVTDAAAVEASTAAIGGVDVFLWAFHWEDVDPDLLAADLGEGYPVRMGTPPPWGSATLPPAAASMLGPAVVAKEAEAIDVPVFVGVGERDVCPDPWAEPSAYRSSTDVTLVVVPTMAHMHNFAGTRRRLWERLHAWAASLPG